MEYFLAKLDWWLNLAPPQFRLSSSMIQASPLSVTVMGRQKSVSVRRELLTYQTFLHCMKVQLGAQKSVTVRGELLTVQCHCNQCHCKRGALYS